MNRGFRFAAGLALAVSLPAIAHDYVNANAAGWCAGGNVVTTGSFEVSGQALAAFMASDACPSGLQEKDCGVFDDDYHAALTFATAECVLKTQAIIGMTDIVSVAPVVSGPSTFLSTHHHLFYQAIEGVRGQCRACRIGTAPLPGSGGAGH